MIPHKPYVPKPMAHSPRGLEVLENCHSFEIWTILNEGESSVRYQVRLRDPGQCVAALRAAKAANIRCMVYAVGTSLGEECLEIVDEQFLIGRMK